MPQTKSEFAATVKAKYPAYATWDDDALVTSVLEKYPAYRDQVRPDEWRRPLLATVARVGGGLVGGAAGGILGAAGTLGLGTGVGMAAGGALGAAAGEALGEWIEGTPFSPTRIGVEGALGALPITKAASIPRAILKAGGMGAAQNLVSQSATALSQDRLPSQDELLRAGVMGFGVGGLLGGAVKAKWPTLGDTTIPQLQPTAGHIDDINFERSVIEGGPTLPILDHNFQPTPKLEQLGGLEKAKYVAGRTAANITRDYADMGADMRRLVDDTAMRHRELNEAFAAQRQAGIAAPFPSLPAISTEQADRLVNRPMNAGFAAQRAQGIAAPFPQSPQVPKSDIGAIYDIIKGGQGGKTEAWKIEAERVLAEAEGQGLSKALQDYLDIRGLGHGARTLMTPSAGVPNRNPVAPSRANPFGRSPALQKLLDGKALGAGKTTPNLRQSYLELKRQLTPAQFTQVKQMGNQLTRLNRRLLHEAHGAGLISDKVFAEIQKRPDDYVPLNRMLKDPALEAGGSGGQLDLKAQSVLQQLDGSNTVSLSPLDSMASRAEDVYREAGRNTIARSFQDLSDSSPFLRNVLRPVAENAPNRDGFAKIGFLENGERHSIEVPTILARALTTAGPEAMPGSGFLRLAHATTQKLMTAMSPAFNAVNLIRDSSDTMHIDPDVVKWRTHDPRTWKPFVLEAGAFGKDLAKGFLSAIREDNTYLEYLRSGGANSGIAKQLEIEMGGHQKGLLGAVSKMSQAIENAPKIAGMRRGQAAGLRGDRLALRVRREVGSPDFAVKGWKSANTNTLFTFFNASLQGVRRNYKELVAGNGKWVDPEKIAKKLKPMALSAGTFAIAAHKWNSQFTNPDSGLPEWHHIPQQEKDANFIFILPTTYTASDGMVRHKTVKWPKGHIDKLLHNPISNIVDGGWELAEGRSDLGKFGLRLAQLGLDTAENFVPGSVQLEAGGPATLLKSAGNSAVASLNPFIKTPLELATNTNTFQRIPIEPERMGGLEKGERFRATTSASAKTLGQLAAPILSPVQVEYATRSLAPGVGEMVRDAVDWGLGEPRTQTLPDASLANPELWNKMPGVGTIARRFLGSSIDDVDVQRMSRFYGALDTASQANKTLQTIAKDTPRFAALSPERKQAMQLKASIYRPLNAMASKLGDLRQQREAQMAQDPQSPVLTQLRQQEKVLLGQIDLMVERFGPLLEGKPMAPPR